LIEITEKDMLEGIRSWVEVESQTANINGVNQLMTMVAEAYEEIGAKAERVPAKNKAVSDHLSVSSNWGGDEPGILVLSHLDTVHPSGTLDKLPFSIDGDRAYGPGTYDMKGGAYIAYAAYSEIVRNRKTTPLPIRFLYVSDEETGSTDSRPLIEETGRNSKYILVTEGAREGGKVVTARNGASRYFITTHGTPAHSGSRHRFGHSAIKEMAYQILALEALTDYDRQLTLNVGEIEGGTTANTIPSFCKIHLDIRHASMKDAEQMDAHIKSLKSINPEVSISVTGQINRPPFKKNPGIEGLFKRAQDLAKEIGFTLEDVKTGGGSDGNFLAEEVPTLDGLGVDGGGAHTLEEHLKISSLVPRKTLMRRLFETLT